MTNPANQAITAPDLNSSHTGVTARAGIFIFIFMLSGLSGLIYESIWSHYLKLFLGHAAYAQSLVLAIFMGGMAGGAWLAGRFSVRWKNVLLGYALAEGLIGVSALLFHDLFDQFMQAAFVWIIPHLGSVAMVHAFKWTLAGLLILPQSILLGMTFPLMCAGVLRLLPNNSGKTIASLYFANSFGGAIGVLLSGYVLIAHVGLPGTIMLAGVVNILLALTVWLLTRQQTATLPARADVKDALRDRWFRILLVAAMITGAASFMYEIAWIRMLSMVLGSSTHAFELMLSAFIFGLAFGGLWIRRRIEMIADQVHYVAWVQMAMGVLAMLSLVMYGFTFELMHVALDSFSRTESGYLVFNTSSHLLALLVMIPATFCAGMTLPLMTNALLRNGNGESSIGSVYAANTVGAIIGVLLSVHVLISLIGVKGLVIVGGILDIGLGLALLRLTAYQQDNRKFYRLATVSVVTILLFISSVQLDPAQMASGVYRHGHAALPADSDILYHRDGKTATITLYASEDGNRVISTNGKPDAAIQMVGNQASGDEVTMVLAGTLPLAYHPEARTIANIGMGSGLTTHTLLGADSIERVDTIEIERAMVEGAKYFIPHVERAYSDPRSNIHIEDARTFFSTNGHSYDIIVSEPSNPWVSGVANLFTTEFYAGVTRYLAPDGLFVQWLQIYEIDTSLVASVLRALSGQFSDYVVYNTDSSNILIIARKEGSFDKPGVSVFADTALRESLERVNIRNVDDLLVRYIGNKSVLDPYFYGFGTPENSDYFPYLDQHAVKSRYLGHDAQQLNDLNMAPLPALEMLEPGRQGVVAANVSLNRNLNRTTALHQALQLRDVLARGIEPELIQSLEASGTRTESVILARLMLEQCTAHKHPQLWQKHMLRVAISLIPHLSSAELRPAWDALKTMPCYADLQSDQQHWIELLTSISARDGAAMARQAERLLVIDQYTQNSEIYGYLLAAAMLGHMQNDDPAMAMHAWNTHAARLLRGKMPGNFLRFLYLAAKTRH
jgi:spermidine synthase